MSFWASNINGAGRLLRIISGLILGIAAFFLYQKQVAVWPWVLGTSGAFMVFEGLRGWCLLRACKIKTPL